MIDSRIDEQSWIRCGKCGHKLGRLLGAGHCDPPPMVEVKCHSCKEINIWYYTPFKKETEHTNNSKGA